MISIQRGRRLWRLRPAAMMAAAAWLLVGCGSTGNPTGSTGGSAATATPYAVTIKPASFTDQITNRYFPLKLGRYVYEGTKEGVKTRSEMVVTADRKMVMGVRCVVIHDSVFVADKLEEETFDWYAQDARGNVWYFGEDSKELDAAGKVKSTHGSWEAGVNGAQPGIIMGAHPAVGDRYQQEYAKGVAEDFAKVLSVNESVQVTAGAFRDVVKTEDLTALDPSKLEHKWFAPGVGFVKGEMVKGGAERTQLIRFTPQTA